MFSPALVLGAAVATSHEGAWTAAEESSCIAENTKASPTTEAEREELIARDPVARIDAVFGGAMAFGSPGAVGAYLGHTKEGTPASVGWSSFVRADVTAMRPLWISAQVNAMFTPKMNAVGAMTDVFVGWDFSGWGNQWSVLRRKRSSALSYDCVFGRYDVAFVGGWKRAFVYGDPRVDGWGAVAGGVQMRFLRGFMNGTLGIDFDVIGLYDPDTRGGGAEARDVLHIGAFTFTQAIGFVWHRGAWGTIGIGAHFDL